MNTELITAIVGFCAAIVGLITAIVERKKEVIHRFEAAPAPTSKGWSLVGCSGLVLFVGGTLIGVVMLLSFVGVFAIRSVDEAKHSTTKERLDAIDDALRMYFLKEGSFPASLEELTSPRAPGKPAMLSKARLSDARGQAFQYDSADVDSESGLPLVWVPDPSLPGGRLTNRDKR